MCPVPESMIQQEQFSIKGIETRFEFFSLPEQGVTGDDPALGLFHDGHPVPGIGLEPGRIYQVFAEQQLLGRFFIHFNLFFHIFLLAEDPGSFRTTRKKQRRKEAAPNQYDGF